MKNLDELMKFSCSINKLEDMRVIFDVFLTAEERNAIDGRFAIVKELLSKNLTQREISAKHKVSIAKVTRGSNDLKRLNSKAIEFLKSATGVKNHVESK